MLETGVEVMGTYKIMVEGRCYTPWAEAKISVGDRIISLDGIAVTKSNDLDKVLKAANGEQMTIAYVHNNKECMNSITPIKKKDGTYSLGMYVKDHVKGIGTLTYVIPNLNIYGALGHSIIDNEEIYNGYISQAKVINIKKATENNVGEKKAEIDNHEIGNIEKNAVTGIHGHISDLNCLALKKYKIGTKNDIKKGKAKILTTIDGEKIEEFSIEIVDLDYQDKKEIKGIKLKVTDERLISKTGGIIQGMSGSPIIQNDRIVGAVTHVLVKNPLYGYGIYIEWMLSEMDISIE